MKTHPGIPFLVLASTLLAVVPSSAVPTVAALAPEAPLVLSAATPDVNLSGLDRPFKVFRQYRKAVGTKVDVKFRGGRRLVATLTDATEDTVTLAFTALEAVEGKNKKEKVDHCDTFPLTDINSVTPYVEFDK